VEAEQHAAPRSPRLAEQLAQLGLQRRDVDPLRPCRTRARALDERRLVPQRTDRRRDLLRLDPRRVVAQIEAIRAEVDLDVADPWKPVQGFLDPVGSIRSGDAFGLDESGDAQ
jgi:hypothetical protein